MAAYLNRELELAFAQLAVAPQWNTGSEGGLKKRFNGGTELSTTLSATQELLVAVLRT